MRISSAKVAAAICMGLLLSLYVHYDYARWGALGLNAFLLHETDRFNQYMTNPRPTIFITLCYVAVALIGAVLYEAIAVVFSKVFGPKSA